MSYRKNTYEILKELGSDPNKGLSNEEVRKRRNQYGTNELKKQKKKSLFGMFLEQFQDPMVVI